MGHPFGFGLQGRVNDRITLGLVVVRFAPTPRSNLPDLVNARLPHPLAPEFHGVPVNAELICNRSVLLTDHSAQNDPAPQCHLLGSPVCGLPS